MIPTTAATRAAVPSREDRRALADEPVAAYVAWVIFTPPRLA